MSTLTLTITGASSVDRLAALDHARDRIAQGDTSGHGTVGTGSYTFATVEGDALSAATTVAVDAEEREVQIALRELCESAREAFPTASRIVLNDSDQGDWAVIDAVEDAAGTDLSDDDDWLVDDGYELASHLYSSRTYVWEPFLVPGTGHDRRNPCQGTLLIDEVLAAL